MTPETATVRLSRVIFDELLYPRKDHDPILVQRYAGVLDEIEAAGKRIALTADLKLLDGKHRWLAYRKRYDGEDREIPVFIYPVTTPHEQLMLAAKLNSDHGWQLTDADKELTAKTLFAYGATYDDIAQTLSVGKAKVSAWLAHTVKEQKDRRNQRIVELWMACETQEAIAKAVDATQQTVSNVIDEFTNSVLENQNGKDASLANHATDFEPPIYNIWRQQKKSDGV